MSKFPSKSETMDKITSVSAGISERAGKVVREQIGHANNTLHYVAVNVASYQLPEGLSRESAYETMRNAYGHVKEYERVHPIQSKVARTALIGAGVAVAAPVAAQVLVAKPLGWGTYGVIKAAKAAAIQSSVYGGAVPAGSLFAWATSLGAGGYAAQQLAFASGGGYVAFEAIKASFQQVGQKEGSAVPPKA